MASYRRRIGVVLIVAIAVLVAIQIIPYGRTHTNPPVAAEPSWDTPATRDLFARTCADCHSNETRWPWYSHVAPVSWLVAHDVAEGRERFNVSEWGLDRRNEGDEAADMLSKGEMPPRAYLLAHPEARLASEERATLIRGLATTFGEGRQRKADRR